MSLKKCVICGFTFGTQRKNARYCSDGCKRVAHKKTSRSMGKRESRLHEGLYAIP